SASPAGSRPRRWPNAPACWPPRPAAGRLRGLRADLRGGRRSFTAVGRCAGPALSASVEATLETGQGWHFATRSRTAMKDQEMLARSGEIVEDSGTLGLTVYGNVGTGIQTVLSYTDTGQVQRSVAWLTGGFTGTEGPQGPEPAGIEIAQLWDDNGTLGLNIYGSVGGNPQAVFAQPDMGHGSSALAFLAGNFTGSATTEIAQLWDNNGVLGLIIYGMSGGTLQTLVTYPDMGQRSSALAFLVGDFTGSGATEIAQLWDNNGILGLIVYGVGNGSL